MSDTGNERETGPRPLATRSQDGRRGPAYTAAVERSEAAVRHVRQALGDEPWVIDDAGQLGALAAALPPETGIRLDNVIRVAAPGDPGEDGWVPAVVATMITLAQRPATPVRDHQGTEYDVMVPGVQLGTVLLPGPDATPAGEPRSWRPWRAWDRMLAALDAGEAHESLEAVGAVVDRIAGLLADHEDGPGGLLPDGSPTAARIPGAAAALREVAAALAVLAADAAGEQRRQPAGLGRRDRVLPRVRCRVGPSTG